MMLNSEGRTEVLPSDWFVTRVLPKVGPSIEISITLESDIKCGAVSEWPPNGSINLAAL